MLGRILVLLVASAVIGAQADSVTQKECSDSDSFPGPLDRTYPTRYDMTLQVASDSPVLETAIEIRVKIDDSKSQQEEPKNVIVLDADKAVDVDMIAVVKLIDTWPGMSGPLEVDVCRDSKRLLLVLKFKEDLEDKSTLSVMTIGKSPIRDDNRGVYKQNQVFKVNFADSQAHLSIPCFKDPKYDAVILSRLAYSKDLTGSSETLTAEEEGAKYEQNFVILESDGPMSLDKFSFEIRPANN